MYNNKEKKTKDISIKIDSSRIRYTNKEIDINITIIEIKQEEDKINIGNYLEIEEEEMTEDECRKRSIYYITLSK